MSFLQVTQICEIKFWNAIILIMEEEGALMKIIKFLKKLIISRIGYLLFLFFTFAAVGFLSGMILGRIIWMVQMH